MPATAALIPRTATDLELPRDRNPAVVYLGRLAKSSRETMLRALGRIAQVLRGSAVDAVGRFIEQGRGKAAADAAAYACPWWMLRYQHTQRLRVLLQEESSPSTVNLHLSALRGVLKECWRLELMSAEDYQRAIDIQDIKHTTLPAGRMLTPEEVRKLFAVASVRDAAILAVMYAGGLRRAEVASLDLDSFTDGTLVVRGKGNKMREVPVVDAAKELSAWLKARKKWAKQSVVEPALFLNRSGTRITPPGILSILKNLATAAGVDDISPHDLRRTFASVAIDNTKDVFGTQELLGHASSDTTKKYDRRGAETRRRIVATIKIPRPK